MTVGLQAGSGVSRYGPAVGAVAQFTVLAVLAAGVGLHAAGWLVGTVYAVVTWATVTQALNRSGMPTLGPANAVTLTRAVLAGGVAALVADATAVLVATTAGFADATSAATAATSVPNVTSQHTSVAALVALAGVALVLDAVDGKVARRTGTSSSLGARFDMETDAFLVLVLSLFVARSLGWWVLAIGAFRYLFLAAAWALPWLKAPLPPRFSRKTVAAVQGIVLVVASADVLPRPVTVAVVGASLGLLTWSFGRDIEWLWRVRPAPRSTEPRSTEPQSDQREYVMQAAGAFRGGAR